jgi:hypothetical protein
MRHKPMATFGKNAYRKSTKQAPGRPISGLDKQLEVWLCRSGGTAKSLI